MERKFILWTEPGKPENRPGKMRVHQNLEISWKKFNSYHGKAMKHLE